MGVLLLCAPLVLALLRGSTPLEERVEKLSKQLAVLHRSPSPTVAKEAAELESQAKAALKSHAEADLKGVLAASTKWVKSLSAREEDLHKSEALERLQAQAEHLEPKVDAAVRAKLEKAVKDANGLELHAALTDAVEDLKAKIATLNREEANLTVDIRESKTAELIRLLREREKLPIGTQRAVLKRKEFTDFPLAQQLLNSTDTSPLFEQLKKLAPDAKVPEEDVHHDKGVHSASRRVFVVSSHMKNLVAGMRKKLEGVREQLKDAVAHKKGDASAVDSGAKILTNLDAMLKNLNGTNDLQSQLKQLEDFESKLGI